jgi:hypothetical protein
MLKWVLVLFSTLHSSFAALHILHLASLHPHFARIFCGTMVSPFSMAIEIAASPADGVVPALVNRFVTFFIIFHEAYVRVLLYRGYRDSGNDP